MGNKPNKPVRLSAKDEQQQIIRAVAMKREQYFQLILGGLLRNEAVTRPTLVTVSGNDGKRHEKVNIIDIIDAAFEGSGYIIDKMYTNDKEGE